MNVRHGHSSSRYDRSPQSLANQVGRAVGSDKAANLLTFTEVGNPKRAAKLQADGWGRFVPDGKTDCGIMWLKSEWSKVHSEVRRLTGKTWRDGQGNTHHQDCTTVVLDGDDGRVWLSLIHLPSGVQNGDRFATDNDDNVAAWKGAVRGWADYHHDAKRQWKPNLTLYVADWNIDFRSQHWRSYVNDVYPNCKGTWRKDSIPPSGGTHGKRLIDATWTDGRFQKVALLKDDDSSDHRPYGEVIGWPA